MDAGMSVLGSEDGGFKNEYGDGDLIYLSRGQGATPGSQFVVARPIRTEYPVDRTPLLTLLKELALRREVRTVMLVKKTPPAPAA